MIRTALRTASAVAVLVFCSAASVLAQDAAKHAISFDDMMQMHRVGSPQISPDGKWVLSVMPSQPSKLVLYPTGIGQAQLIDASPAHLLNTNSNWTSDGSAILFTGAEQNGPPRA